MMMNAHLPTDETGGAPERETIAAVLPFAARRSYEPGETLLETAAAAQCFYYVETGTLEVSYTAEGTAIVVALIGPGAFCGEIGFFDGLARTRTIKALSGGQLRVFDRTILDRITADDPGLAARFLETVLRAVCRRFRRILSDRGPLTAYAAALSTGREHFKGMRQLPADLLGSAGWQQLNQELEQFKARMFDVAYRLQEAQDTEIAPHQQAEAEAVLDRFFEKVRHAAALADTRGHAELMWGYMFKELFPYLARSRFYERAYYKPKGYAGDFFMIERIYRNQPDGDGKFGRLIDGWLLKRVPARAVRNRRRLLHRILDRLCRERLHGPGPIRIMNLACGPCRELFDLVGGADYSDRIDALCVDIDAEALQFAHTQVDPRNHGARVRFMHENVIRWALGRSRQQFDAQDLIYTSGLCDYLDRRLVKALIEQCHSCLKPGGVLIIGNFAPANPDRALMDHLMYWRLIYRDRAELGQLFADTPFGGRVTIEAEEQGVNLFALARREPR
ncbi:cyclic nucleotide-binding domain-containing protein [Desulfatitalea alkaliphila]|uniref:Cyclic nucleotide-binding domain-containing protein n=1 Tax=Desulfatitalea alkaliphila TaxID=2929485 RepID=A0AA41R6U1_9BACT|nr:cyclic nucleotide-binding domain-containing protein [Desulfatitalea alkaliphila]MCJ8502280.1 cyclic nucleotide-binding domain-containing protein [Desulfatitalea alkaliphila]